MAMNWVIAGGGTGGHVTPALALAEAIRRRDPADRVLFVGSDRGLEARLVPEAGFELEALPSRPILGRGPLGAARGALAMLRASLGALRALARVEADIAISVGGYAAGPTIVAAGLRGTPLALVEPNAIPGRANRLAARRACLVFVGFEVARERLRQAGSRGAAHCVGVPLRQQLVSVFRDATARSVPAPPFRLLVFGGSQGARQINQAILDALPELEGCPIEIFHQTGEADRLGVEAAYAKSGVQAQVVAYEPDMPARYRWAHLAVCRAGALSVAELALAGLPAVLIPYPHAADDHQAANARELESQGAALCLDARPLDPHKLAGALRALFEAPERLAAMSEAALRSARPDAADLVAEACAAEIEGRR